MLIDTITQNFRQTNGILYLYDTSRFKWISVTRESISFSIDHRNIAHNRWFNLIGKSRSNITGYRIPRNCIITCITIQSEDSTDCEILIRKNNNPSNLYNITLSSEGSSVDNLDISLYKDDWVQTFLQVNLEVVSYPAIMIELAWII